MLLTATALTAMLSAPPAIAQDFTAAVAGVSDRANAVSGMSHFYSVVREPAAGLPDHTVFRPEKLNEFPRKSLPVVFWANGACSPSNFGYTFLSTILAAHGFVVVANGVYNAEPANGTATPSLLTDAMNWASGNYAVQDDAGGNARTQFRDRLDLNKIAVAGQSCGGLEALVAGADPRVKTVMAFNTGFFSTPTPANGYPNGIGREQLQNLHVPVLIVNGGTTDVAYQNSIDNYNILVAQGTAAYLASNANAGHSGLWFGIVNGVGNTFILTEAERLAVNWLDYLLNGTATAGQYFFGPNCQVCDAHRDPYGDWTSQTNIDVTP